MESKPKYKHVSPIFTLKETIKLSSREPKVIYNRHGKSKYSYRTYSLTSHYVIRFLFIIFLEKETVQLTGWQNLVFPYSIGLSEI